MKESLSAYDQEPAHHSSGGAGIVLAIVLVVGIGCLLLFGGVAVVFFWSSPSQQYVDVVLSPTMADAVAGPEMADVQPDYPADGVPREYVIQDLTGPGPVYTERVVLPHSPHVAPQPSEELNSLVIECDGKGTASIDGTATSLEGIGEQLDQTRQAGEAVEEVVIRLDKACTSGTLLELLDLVREHGIERISIAVLPVEAN